MRNAEATLVDSYLSELEEALVSAPADRRREIVGEIRAHIDEEMRVLGHEPSETDIRRILDSLGEPEAIAGDVQPRVAPPTARLGFLEVAALVLLLIGGFLIPFIGWVAGVVLLWISPAWDLKRKLLGTVVVPLGLAAPFFLLVFAPGGWLPTALMIVLAVAAIWSAVHLAREGKKRLAALGGR